MKNSFVSTSFLFIVFVVMSIVVQSCTSGEEWCCDEEILLPPDTVRVPPVIIEEPVIPVDYKVTIQIGAFRDETLANAFYSKAQNVLSMRVDKTLDRNDGLFKITVGVFDKIDAANNYLRTVINAGYSDAFVRDLK